MESRVPRSVAWLFVIGVGACGAVVASGQAARQAGAPALSPELRAHVQTEVFQPVTSLRGMPLGVREALGTLFGTRALDIAEPDAPFGASGVASEAALPIRRLVMAGCSYEHCLVYYERGGTARSWRVVLFHWTPDATRFQWGGRAPGGLTSVDDARRVVLSGGVTASGDPW